MAWYDRLPLSTLIGAAFAWLLARVLPAQWPARDDPARHTPHQALTPDGVVICTARVGTTWCGHQALHHNGGEGCTFCACPRDEREFVYPRPKP